jgi:rRNA processing protein Krr1/Pno1
MMSHVTAGFEVADAVALLRLSDLYIESFEVKDVKVHTQSIAAAR